MHRLDAQLGVVHKPRNTKKQARAEAEKHSNTCGDVVFESHRKRDDVDPYQIRGSKARLKRKKRAGAKSALLVQCRGDCVREVHKLTSQNQKTVVFSLTRHAEEAQGFRQDNT